MNVLKTNARKIVEQRVVSAGKVAFGPQPKDGVEIAGIDDKEPEEFEKRFHSKIVRRNSGDEKGTSTTMDRGASN